MGGFRTGITVDIPDDVFFGIFFGTIAMMFLAVAVVLFVRVARTWKPRHRMRAIESLSRKTNLVIPENLREHLARVVAARTRGEAIGSLVGLATLALLIRPWEDPPPSLGSASVIVAIAVVLIGPTAGAALGGMFGRRSMHMAPRTARITPLSYSDLVAPDERSLVSTCMVAGVALPAMLAILTAAPWVARDYGTASAAHLLLLAGLLSAGLGLGLPRIGRRLIATRAIAGDEHALAWSDALAARTLRDVAYFVVAVSGVAGLAAILSLSFALPQDWSAVADMLSPAAAYLGVTAYIAAIVIVTTRNPERHVQRTLWPEFAVDTK